MAKTSEEKEAAKAAKIAEKEAIKAAKLAEKEQAKAAKAAEKLAKNDTTPADDAATSTGVTNKTLTYQGVLVNTPVLRVVHNGHNFLKFKTINGHQFMIPASDANMLIEA